MNNHAIFKIHDSVWSAHSPLHVYIFTYFCLVRFTTTISLQSGINEKCNASHAATSKPKHERLLITATKDLEKMWEINVRERRKRLLQTEEI